MIKTSALLLGGLLSLTAFTAAAQNAVPAAPAKPAVGAAAAPAAADDATKKAEDAAKAERRARFDLRATEEGDKQNDTKKTIDTLTEQNADPNAKTAPEVLQQRKALIEAYTALNQSRQELVGALKTYEQAAVTTAEAAVAEAQFECEMAQQLLEAVNRQAGIAGRAGEGAQDPRVREAAKKVLDGVKAGIDLQRQARALAKKTAELQKQQQNLQDDLEIQILTVMKEQRAKGGN